MSISVNRPAVTAICIRRRESDRARDSWPDRRFRRGRPRAGRRSPAHADGRRMAAPSGTTDKRKIGVIVHHVASIYPLEIQLAQVAATGKPITDVTWRRSPR